MLLTKEVEVVLSTYTAKYYENLGYYIPKYFNKEKNKYVVARNTKIKVNVNDLPLHSSTIIQCKCDLCNNIVSKTYASYIVQNHEGKTYCKRCCKKVDEKGNKKINNNLSNGAIKSRSYIEYTEFTQIVLKRDNYTCIKCGKKANVTHHLNGYAWFIEGRTDPKNAVSLCNNCHNNFHSIYGKGRNTRMQFKVWLNRKINDYDLEYKNIFISPTKVAYCIEDDEIIYNIREYARNNKLDSSSIYCCCNGKKKSHKNKHYCWYNDKDKPIPKNNNIKKIVQLSLDGKFIKEWSSISEANKIYSKNGKGSSIPECCKKNGRQKTAYGYIWKYKSDYDEDDERRYI